MSNGQQKTKTKTTNVLNKMISNSVQMRNIGELLDLSKTIKIDWFMKIRKL